MQGCSGKLAPPTFPLQLPLTGLIKHKTYMTAGFHDHHVTEYSVCGKDSVTSGRETIKNPKPNKKKDKMLKPLHRMCFSMFFISIDT